MRGDLEGWKAIAEFLGRRARTVQLWEKELGLPVRRLNKRVFAQPAELDEWRRRNESVLKLQEDAPESAPVVPPASSASPQRRPIALWAGLAALVLAGAGIGAVRILSRREPPIDYRIVGATLIVTGNKDVELWRHTFPDALDPNPYANDGHVANCVFADLDGDGEAETLFVYQPLRNATTEQQLVCFSPRGEPRWRYRATRRVVDWVGRVYEPPFPIHAFVVFRPPGSIHSQILIVHDHNWSFPSQAAMLDGRTGKLVAEYWHRGHLRKIAVADLDGDGEPELLLGGVNDAPEVAQAEVVIFDHRRMSGSATGLDGQPYFRDLSPGTEKAIVRFPKSEISRRQEFNIVHGLRTTGTRIIVAVTEGTHDAIDPCIVYELSKDLTVVNTALCDGFEKAYRNVLGLAPPKTLAEHLRQAVTVIRRTP